MSIVVLFAALAAHYILVRLYGLPGGTPFDIYGYYLPIKLYAVQSVFDGFKGLLWTPFQSCGEPFFANSATGLLYPLHWLFLVLEANLAVHVILGLNMLIGAIGMLLLLRELGLNWAASIAGALVYELGDPMGQLTIWSPMQNGSWAWASWGLYLCERLLRRPTRAGVVGLAGVLVMSILPGWALIAALTYQLIAFRLAWELITLRTGDALRACAAVAAALVLAPCIGAVQMIPALEFAQESYRVGVEVSDFVKFPGFSPDELRKALHSRLPPPPFVAALLPLVLIGPFTPSHRRLATFWFLIGALYTVLALGHVTPLYALFIQLPPGPALIRYSHRLFWISGLSTAFLTAFVAHAITDARVRRGGRWLRLAAVIAVVMLMYAYAPGDLRPIEIGVAAMVGLTFAVALWQPARPLAAWMIPAAAAINLMIIPVRYAGRLLPSLDSYYRNQQSFEAVRDKITAQDRVLFYPSPASLMSLTLMHKTASIMRIKELYDYDALMVRRIVDYYNMLHRGEAVHSIDELFRPNATPGFRPRLLDLAAIRYVITVPATKVVAQELPLTRMGEVNQGIELYRNDHSLNRARFVPRMEIASDASVLLQRLAYGSDDLERVAFAEGQFPSGFQGTSSKSSPGTADFVLDDPEHLIIAVDAPARGFLFVADQFYPGWIATVDGTQTPIIRANHAFRLIEVPAGKSTVEMRYRPTSVYAGALISTAAVVACGILLWRGRRRP